MKGGTDISSFLVQEVILQAQLIDERIERYGIDHEAYVRSIDYQDLVAMPMLRICELINEHKDAFERIDPKYPWNLPAGLRNKIAHPYGGLDYEVIWQAVEHDLPRLVDVCKKHIEK